MKVVKKRHDIQLWADERRVIERVCCECIEGRLKERKGGGKEREGRERRREGERREGEKRERRVEGVRGSESE